MHRLTSWFFVFIIVMVCVTQCGCQSRAPEFVKPGWTLAAPEAPVMILMPPRPGAGVPDTAQYEVRDMLLAQVKKNLPVQPIFLEQAAPSFPASELAGLVGQAANQQSQEFSNALIKAGSELGARYFLFTEIIEWKERPFRHAGSADYDPYWEPWYHPSPARHHHPWVRAHHEYEGIDYFAAINVKIWDATTGELVYDNYEKCTHTNYRGGGSLALPAKECISSIIKSIPGAGAARAAQR